LIPYTELNDQTICQILSKFDIGQIQNWQLLFGGAENTNHYVKTEKGQYVLTICEQKSVEETTILANLLNYLDRQKFETTKVIPNQEGKIISAYKGKCTLLKSYIEGSIELTIDKNILLKIGRSLAQLHLIPAPSYSLIDVNNRVAAVRC